jgi:RimJ/RimL family protein N-acetyltransferase
METNPSLWQAKRVRLRAVEPENWALYDGWNRDDEQARAMDAVPFPQSREAVKRWAAEESLRLPTDDRARFVIENTEGEAVGDVTVHGTDRRVGTFSYGITVRREHRRRGYASEAIALVLRYFFQELRYQKATVRVFDFNEASIRLHERLGFTLEGRLRRMTYGNGRYADELVFGLLAEEFEALAEARLP